MIARIWHATATPSGADAYRRHFTEAVLPELQKITGHQGAYLLQHPAAEQVDIQVITFWASLDAIRSFAGEDLDTAVVEPDAQAALLTYSATVVHHDVIIAAPQPSTAP
ncbi:Antibiotic biosynthesis monooxygenase [Nonomuraea solani]|uniref:Antibiotic biosynthesis monooxygenase n=1 Tax=Nonomuraea solani TaxID=1144553 RepID=A0A1H6CYH6_9ACTN|nr:antibiotic biosynthesis monooxygenase [Nonomuraea solani]SEG78130.1 Antibiotic biosynthesis monooxygenase [Nonomuraea solani]